MEFFHQKNSEDFIDRSIEDDIFVKNSNNWSCCCGLPINAIENLEGSLVVDPSFLKAEDAFALRVKGDSMINAELMIKIL
jgi:hypothetical protein